MFSALKRVGVAVALTAIAGSAIQAQVMNTGQLGGPTDPFWTVSYNLFGPQPTGVNAGNVYGPTSGGPIAATVITTIPSPPWNPNLPNARWIGISSNGNAPVTAGHAVGDGIMRFEYTFATTILGNATITGGLGWDNQLVGYTLNGGALQLFTPAANFDQSGFCRDGDGELPSAAYPNCTRTFAITGGVAGQTLRIIVRGDGQTDGLLLNQATTVPEPSTYALMATGLLGIVGFARRRRAV